MGIAKEDRGRLVVVSKIIEREESSGMFDPGAQEFTFSFPSLLEDDVGEVEGVCLLSLVIFFRPRRLGKSIFWPEKTISGNSGMIFDADI